MCLDNVGPMALSGMSVGISTCLQDNADTQSMGPCPPRSSAKLTARGITKVIAMIGP